MRSIAQLSHIFNTHFPRLPLQSLFGYGSGVLYQSSNPEVNKNKTIDFLLEVQSLSQFHRLNYATNPKDYQIPFIMTAIPFLTRITFPMHTGFFEHEKQTVRYMVTDSITLQSDLAQWDKMIFSGRMHKPMAVLNMSERTEQLMKKNYQYAIVMGIMSILLKKSSHSISNTNNNNGHLITLDQLYQSITEISYKGDIRRMANIDHKSQKIVSLGRDEFHNIYLDRLKQICQSENGVFKLESNEITIKDQIIAMKYLIRNMPQRFRNMNQKQIQSEIQKTIKYNSFKMMMYNSLTLSPIRSLRYLFKKLRNISQNKL